MTETKLYHDCITYNLFGTDVYLYSDEYEFGISTVAEIEGRFYYLGSEPPSLLAAIFAFQEFYDIELSDEELKQLLEDFTNSESTKGE